MAKKRPKKKPGKKNRKPSVKGKSADDAVALPDRRGIEGMMAGLFGGAPASPVEAAQEIMYDAWESADPKRRLALARKAMETSPDCADAYVLLAEESAPSLNEALALYRKGVEAGERTLGKEGFEEYAGHFWGFIETRPYMRARAGLAQCLWESGKRQEAVAPAQPCGRRVAPTGCRRGSGLPPHDPHPSRRDSIPRMTWLDRQGSRASSS